MKNKEIDDLLEQLFRQAQMQFGSAIKGRWLHDGDGCPGCGKEITVTKYKKQDALSLNAYIFRESQKNPVRKLPIHDEIEKNLKHAFVKHLGH